MATPQAEPVRLVIWDLDETFWGGTLSEGGIRYNRTHHDIVIELARRGIVSSICSKNDMAAVRIVLEREGIWDYFVFPSVNWDSKGPRLAALVEAVQLRAPTVLFIDDNPQNLGEAQHFVPGIQVADETFIAGMLDHPLFKGKNDSQLARLKQYQLLELRQAEEKSFGADNTEFLRSSGLTVTIEHDMELHLDRAIELINRTNQLNFTKQRLPEDIEEARAAFRKLVSGYTNQAGIIRVRDRYGDYGYCGLYVMSTGGGWSRLHHFCFSCRILNMGVESWLYQRLGRPQMKVVGEVLTNVVRDKRRIDWIRLEVPGVVAADAETAPRLEYFYARGGCDLLAVSHYFTIMVRAAHGEHNMTRAGADLRLDHTVFARYGLTGIDAESKRALEFLGYRDQDFASVIPDLPKQGSGVWLLSFWADVNNALYRHRATGAVAPLSLRGVATNMRDLIALPDAESGADPAFLARLRAEFECIGRISEADFKANARLLLSNAPAGARVFVLQANESLRRPNGMPAVARHMQMLNGWVLDIAAEFPHVTLLALRDFVADEAEVVTLNHFDRMVYFRVFQHIVGALAEAGRGADEPVAATHACSSGA
jgi:FkbH-like protein